ncbi:DinB family protein [Nocardioides sp. NPDC057577]|uniref:DinB family protein n=1 Tax=Nocardioides sp. NPDC057577 TaxID=3346171 RepID=UPI00366AC9CB
MSSDQRQVGYDGIWLPEGEDPRHQDEQAVGELATYRDYLRHYRLTLELKGQDLTPEQLARRSVPPSTMSLLGLVRHMAKVEHGWFQRAFQQRLDEPRPYWSADAHDIDFDGAEPTQACVDEAYAAWKEQIARADAWLDTQTDESMGDVVVYNSDGETSSVRDILVHMVEEYARHAGHADLLREVIDGRTGQ